jgi:hypothetical protein
MNNSNAKQNEKVQNTFLRCGILIKSMKNGFFMPSLKNSVNLIRCDLYSITRIWWKLFTLFSRKLVKTTLWFWLVKWTV